MFSFRKTITSLQQFNRIIKKFDIRLFCTQPKCILTVGRKIASSYCLVIACIKMAKGTHKPNMSSKEIFKPVNKNRYPLLVTSCMNHIIFSLPKTLRP